MKNSFQFRSIQAQKLQTFSREEKTDLAYKFLMKYIVFLKKEYGTFF